MPNWNTFEVTLSFVERLIGGIPIVPEGADRSAVYEKWGKGQEVEQDPSYEKPLHEALAEDNEMPTSTEDTEGMENGFRRDPDHGIYIEARQIKANLREAAQRLGYIKQVRGMRQVLQHDLIVRGSDGSQKIFLGMEEPSGKDMRPISVMTRQGPRTAIKKFEYVTRPTITYTVSILSGGVGDGILNEEKLTEMVNFGGFLGIGADRSQGEGTYNVVSVKEIT